MSKFDELATGGASAPPARHQVIDGSFGCMDCSLDADEAKWYHDSKTIVYVCPEGHVSKIENFNL